MKNTLIVAALLTSFPVFALFGFSKRLDEGKVYTLYRSSMVSASRIHVGTFDTDEGSSSEKYNRVNCNISAKLRMGQPFTKTKFWCENGYYKK